MPVPTVFISYSHLDETWKNRLLPHLKALAADDQFEVWEDRDIAAGEDWLPQIESALATAAAAMLLVSADFLASPFITSEEIPRILDRRVKDGLTVIPLILRHCPWEGISWLSQIQARPKDGKPLTDCAPNEVDKVLAELALEVSHLLRHYRPNIEIQTASEEPMTDWSARDRELLHGYFKECAKYDDFFKPLMTTSNETEREYLINSGLAVQTPTGSLSLTRDGTLFCCKREAFPRHQLNVDISLKTVSEDGEDLNVELWGSVLFLFREVLHRIAFLYQRRMGSPEIRSAVGSEQTVYEYPPIVIVESLVNFLIHRNYSNYDVGRVRIFSDRVEFVNPGASVFPPESLMALEEPLDPIYNRNRRLIEAMNKARFNQREGGGILRIKKALRDNRSYRPDGALGLEIRNDDMMDRFSLKIYKRRFILQAPDGGRHGGVLEPRYADAESRHLSLRLKELFQRRKNRTIAGADTRDLQAEILDVRRRLRRGPQLLAGEFLGDGRYELLEQIGQGGFATVWKAWDEEGARIVAIKVLHGHHSDDRSRWERFFRGARLMVKLEHSRIVRVLDNERSEYGWRFFVMEYLPEGSFEQAVLAGGLTLKDRLTIIAQVGEALQFAHEHGVVHRDVKPSNVLLDAEGNAKLTDFDLVRAEDTTGLTATRAMMGTVQFAAPEALESARNATPQADVYSLGALAVFALRGGRLPPWFYRDPARAIAELECSAELKRELARATAFEIGERFASVAEFCQALTAASALEKPKA